MTIRGNDGLKMGPSDRKLPFLLQFWALDPNSYPKEFITANTTYAWSAIAFFFELVLGQDRVVRGRCFFEMLRRRVVVLSGQRAAMQSSSGGARWNILLLLLSAFFLSCYAAKEEEEASVAEPFFVYVYATHKTGSTFISHLLHRLGTLKHNCVLSDNIDVETGIAEVLPATAMTLRNQCPSGGFVMTRGPSNHPANAEISIAERLSKASAPGRCLSIFQTRDPRDVAVSQFNAFTTSNGYISTKKDREAVLAARSRVHEKGIDQYAIHNWPHILKRYEAPFIAEGIHQQHCATFISEYSDMVHRPELWGSLLAKHLGLDSEWIDISKAVAKSKAYWGTGAGCYKSACNPPETRRAMAWLIWTETQKQKNVVRNMSTHAAFFFSGAYKKRLKPETVDFLKFGPLTPEIPENITQQRARQQRQQQLKEQSRGPLISPRPAGNIKVVQERLDELELLKDRVDPEVYKTKQAEIVASI